MHKKKAILLLLAMCFVLHALDTATAVCETADHRLADARKRMIEYDLKGRDITDPVVLKAMERVQRHRFVDKSKWSQAYGDYPLPIGQGQTISQPYIVALMTQTLALKKTDSVLEIGTGSGYQAAVLAEIAARVYSVEIHEKLAVKAAHLLKSLGYNNVSVKAGDGFFGWEEHAPFDAIILTCAPRKIPRRLVRQLKDGGRIILPLGEVSRTQILVLGTKKGNELEFTNIIPVRFVPMTGEIQKK